MSGYRTGVQILDLLEVFGVEAVFSSPGSEWPVLWEALEREGGYWTNSHGIQQPPRGVGGHAGGGLQPQIRIHDSRRAPRISRVD